MFSVSFSVLNFGLRFVFVVGICILMVWFFVVFLIGVRGVVIVICFLFVVLRLCV